jgi:chromosome segregation ATPase
MIEVRPDEAMTSAGTRLGAQPIALAAATLAIIVAGAGSMALWLATTGEYPETARATAARQLQTRIAQGYEQLVEKTGALETTQQEAIDQLQAVQDQLQSVRRFLAAQQADAKRLSEQVEGLTGAIDSLRQSFASTAPPPEASNSASVRQPSKPRTAKNRHRKRTRS